MNLNEERDVGASGTTSVAGVLGFLQRRLWLCLTIAVPVAVAAVLLAFMLPAVFESRATILIEQPAIPEDIVTSTNSAYVEEQIQVVAQRVLTPEAVAEMIRQFGLYPGEQGGAAESDKFQKFLLDTQQENITTEVNDSRGRVSDATYAFSLGFRYTDPVIAQQVATELADRFLNENVQSRKERAATTTEFLEEEAARLANEIAEYDARIANFKDQYGDALPEQLRSSNDSLRNAENQIARTEQDLSDMRRDRGELLSELSRMSEEQRIGDLQRQYLELSSRYGPEHPDVKRLKRQIEQAGDDQSLGIDASSGSRLAVLEAERDALLERYSPSHPDIVRLQKQIDALQGLDSSSAGVVRSPTNPQYLQIQARLESADADIATAERRLTELRSRKAQLLSSLDLAPQVEREWRQLNRGYEALRNEYEDIKQRSTAARLTESLEAQNIGERFTLVRRASLPDSPIEPNRPAIIFLGIVLALGLSIGVAALTDAMDTTIRSVDDLHHALAAKPLGVIRYMHSAQEIRSIWKRRATFSALFLASIMIIVIVI